MFRWLSRPFCPCDSAAKEWIERRLEWLSREFPSNIFTDHPLILPTDEFFSNQYEPTKEYAKALLVLVCDFMGVSGESVVLKFNHEPQKVLFVNDNGDYLPPAAGMYARTWKRYVSTLDTDQLYHFGDLVTTMAHELAHARLLGEGRLRGRHHDDELLTDLTSFFLGFAIFGANSPRVWNSQFSKWPGTEINKPEYMSSPMYGYALAHLAWFQNQLKPRWARYLGSNVINDFKDATRFLFKTGESSFRPGSSGLTP